MIDHLFGAFSDVDFGFFCFSGILYVDLFFCFFVFFLCVFACVFPLSCIDRFVLLFLLMFCWSWLILKQFVLDSISMFCSYCCLDGYSRLVGDRLKFLG